EKWLAHRRQEAGEECRAMAAARRRLEAAQGELALGQGPCRPRRERACRSARARRRRDGEAEGGGIFRHCEERKRRSNPVLGAAGLLRFARNDGWLTAAPAAYRRRTPRPCRARARG